MAVERKSWEILMRNHVYVSRPARQDWQLSVGALPRIKVPAEIVEEAQRRQKMRKIAKGVIAAGLVIGGIAIVGHVL